jgi:hypothetical protein
MTTPAVALLVEGQGKGPWEQEAQVSTLFCLKSQRFIGNLHKVPIRASTSTISQPLHRKEVSAMVGFWDDS